MSPMPVPEVSSSRTLGVDVVEVGVDDRLVAVSWLSVGAGEEVLVVPSELFRLCAFVSSNEPARQDVELSLTGLQTKPGVFVNPHDGCMIVALLTPLGAAQLLGCPLQGTADRRILLGDLCPVDEVQQLADRVRCADSPALAASALRQWIEQRINAHPPPAEAMARVATAAGALVHPVRTERIGRLAARLSVTQRQLERDFRDWIDVPPATYGRLARLQRAARALAEGQAVTAAAFDSGYADQPHLNRSTNAMMLLSPLKLRIHGTRNEPSALRRVLAGRLLFMSQPGELVERWRVDALPTACPLTRFMQTVRAARRAGHHSVRDRSPPAAR
jgi:AraC-like DNA-binding protein